MSARRKFFTEPLFNAIAVLLELSIDPHNSNPISAPTLAAGLDMSVSSVEKIASDLLKAGILKSVRGARGGFMLARPPERISIVDVMDALDVGPPKKNVSGSLAQVQALRHFLASHNRELLTKISLANIKNSNLSEHPAFRKPAE
jgi:Rrf2 family protein